MYSLYTDVHFLEIEYKKYYMLLVSFFSVKWNLI